VLPKANAAAQAAVKAASEAVAARVARLVDLLVEAVAQGSGGPTLATELGALVESESWAYVTAQVQSTGAAAQAALDAYAVERIQRVAWILDENLQHCPVCPSNADAGPVVRGAAFPSGHAAPPIHPRCGCFLAPVRNVTAES
jgi:formate dehydrogenase maturation protein FdhE